ncbi:GNAT family N-acetyltransferase [Cytobacillus sp. FJAT-54145]|uniref:GNAT family N-acetyltransferase n=1 Tax=Cytobacillus spartinae TaxID=3299023 RepID=A0ABW6KF21_9BACI
MDILKKIEELDFAYLESFTTRKETPWGSLFYDQRQPLYYDANHAHIREIPENPKEVITEVISFYQSLEIIPRFYIYDTASQGELINALKDEGFGYEELQSPVQLWTGEMASVQSREDLTVEVLTLENLQEAIDIECSIEELGGSSRENLLKIEFENPAYVHYLLRKDGKACSTACIFHFGKQARMESVATLKEYRGQGIIGTLIHHIQKEVAKKDLEHFWVFPINERVEKVYARYGFNTVTTITTGHAFLGGKSITEIQQG